MLEYAMALRSDLAYNLERQQEYDPATKDLEVIKWLVEQAQRAKMYKNTLMRIGAEQKPPSSMLANSVLIEANQRFNR